MHIKTTIKKIGRKDALLYGFNVCILNPYNKASLQGTAAFFSRFLIWSHNKGYLYWLVQTLLMLVLPDTWHLVLVIFLLLRYFRLPSYYKDDHWWTVHTLSVMMIDNGSGRENTIYHKNAIVSLLIYIASLNN